MYPSLLEKQLISDKDKEMGLGYGYSILNRVKKCLIKSLFRTFRIHPIKNTPDLDHLRGTLAAAILPKKLNKNKQKNNLLKSIDLKFFAFA